MDNVDEKIFRDIREIERKRKSKGRLGGLLVLLFVSVAILAAYFIGSSGITGRVVSGSHQCIFSDVRMSPAAARADLACYADPVMEGARLYVTNTAFSGAPLILEEAGIGSCVSRPNVSISGGKTISLYLGCPATESRITIRYRNSDTGLSHSITGRLS